MVNPIQITQPQAYSGGADFSPLAGLYDTYKAAQQRAMQEAALARLGNDPTANAQALAQSGVLPLAQMGLGMQDKAITRQREDVSDAQAQANFLAQQKLREAQSTRAGSEEARAQTLFEQQQKFSTREGRLQAAKEGELDIKDPMIARWVALGGEMPTSARAGLGAPVYTRDTATGKLTLNQLSSTGGLIPTTLPTGQEVLGPGEIAQQKAAGTGLGKATAGAQAGLPDVIRTTDTMIEDIDKILNHTAKSDSLGFHSKTPDWALMFTNPHVLDFRERVEQLKGEAMAQNMAMLKGSGLGSVSDFEQKNLVNAYLKASQAKNEKDFNEAMNDARRSAEKIREVARNKAKGDFSEKGTRPAATGAPISTPTSAPAAAKPDPLGLR